jgi:integrase
MKAEKNLKFIKPRDGNPSYYATEITLRGRRIRRFAGYTKDQARQFIARLRLEGPEAVLAPPSAADGRTFGEYARALLDSAEWQGLRSAKRNEGLLKALNVTFKSVPLVDIKPNMVRDYMTRRLTQGPKPLKPASVNRERSLLLRVLNVAKSDGVIASNPISGKSVKRLEEDNSRESRILELGLMDADMRRLIEKADERTRPVVEIALLSGMRLGEILSLRWSQVNFPQRTLTITAAKSKSKRSRMIPLGWDLLEVFRSIRRRGEYVFPNGGTGTHQKSVRKSFESACRRAGIPHGRDSGIVFHDLRHVAATELVKVIDVVTASKILGHASVEMTMRYVHVTDADKRLAIEALGGWLRGPRQKNATPLREISREGLPPLLPAAS